MNKRLEEAFAEASRLPEGEQEAFADWMPDELASERRWQTLLAQRPDISERMADEPLEEYRQGRTEVVDPDQP